MRKELRYSHERIHQLHRESAAGGALAASPASPAPLAAPETDTSRPHSFVSVASSTDAPAASGGGGAPEHAETDDESEWVGGGSGGRGGG